MEINKEILQSIKIVPLLDTLRLEKIGDSEYFSEKYSNYISNSRLGLLKKKGVQAFFEGLGANNEVTSYFQFGTDLHSLVLQPELFELIDSVYKPTAKAGVMADYLYNPDGLIPTDDDIRKAASACDYYKNTFTINRLNEFRNKAEPYWRDRFLFEQKNPPSEKTRIYTDKKSVEILDLCLKSVNNNKEFQKLLHPDYLIQESYIANEQAILLDIEIQIPNYEPVVYKLKSKLDNFSIDFENNTLTVNDLKTTSKPIQYFDIEYFSYQRELAFYMFLLKECARKFFNVNNPEMKGNFLVVSTVPEYDSAVFKLSNSLFMKGWKEVIYLLKVVAYYNVVEKYSFI